MCLVLVLLFEFFLIVFFIEASALVFLMRALKNYSMKIKNDHNEIKNKLTVEAEQLE